MPAESMFIQIGATRDGLDPYLDAARRRGMTAVLVETPDYLRWREVLGRRAYDLTLPVERPAAPEELIAALRALGQPPALVLAGFERYVSSAYVAAQALRAKPAGQSPTFRAPYKQAQRTALTLMRPSVRQPRYALANSLAELEAAARQLTFPIVVKPDDGGGGLGVVMVSDPRDLAHARAALTGVNNYDGGTFKGWVVEEYLPGVELSVQAIARDGVPEILTYCEKLTTVEPESGGPLSSFRESGHVAHPGSEADDALHDFVRNCVSAVGYRQGPFHVDLIRTGDTLHLLEMGFRLSGMRVVELVDRVAGRSWAEETFAAHLGTSPNPPRPQADHRYAGHLTLRRAEQLLAAEAVEPAFGARVEVQRFAPPPLPQDWQRELPATLRSDVVRHAGAVGRVVVSARDPRVVVELLNSCRTPKRVRLPVGDRS
ncbi:ATP-grasp domain-containing protein [Allorhizocola rhizosphaerae]|uniref:ATP-grasp domain-containing protein n=1 Tax=Allorhizocola rhizosphaerae TaxID=1872709 RepID=UPI0013C31B61|nr:ATP-grasp domain-containing protein [Allorhizocola rhizosphaerae]